MSNITGLDWLFFFLGVVLLGWLLAIYCKKRYNIKRREFFVASFYVAGIAIVLIGAYHLLRGFLLLSP